MSLLGEHMHGRAAGRQGGHVAGLGREQVKLGVVEARGADWGEQSRVEHGTAHYMPARYSTVQYSTV